MRQKLISQKDPVEKVVRDIRRKTRRKHSTEEKIRIVLEGLRGEESIAALCRANRNHAMLVISLDISCCKDARPSILGWH